MSIHPTQRPSDFRARPPTLMHIEGALARLAAAHLVKRGIPPLPHERAAKALLRPDPELNQHTHANTAISHRRKGEESESNS